MEKLEQLKANLGLFAECVDAGNFTRALTHAELCVYLLKTMTKKSRSTLSAKFAVKAGTPAYHKAYREEKKRETEAVLEAEAAKRLEALLALPGLEGPDDHTSSDT